MEHYSAIQRKKLQTHHLNEFQRHDAECKRQSQKVTHRMIPFLWHYQKDKTTVPERR